MPEPATDPITLTRLDAPTLRFWREGDVTRVQEQDGDGWRDLTPDPESADGQAVALWYAMEGE